MILDFAPYVSAPGPVITFDIGGTWFRRALVDRDCSIHNIVEKAAISFRVNRDTSSSTLKTELVKYIVEEVNSCRSLDPNLLPFVGISMGAALDQRSGMIWNSAPLWGSDDEPFDLRGALSQMEPRYEWVIINDVTASLLSHVRELSPSVSESIAYVTVSTGIAARTWFSACGGIQIDSHSGLQGEIGHLPVSCIFRDDIVKCTCDCGEPGHLNSFTSGSGMVQALQWISARHRDIAGMLGTNSKVSPLIPFGAALKNNSILAMAVMRAILDPLAKVLLVMLTIDPSICKIIVGGGVVDGIGPQVWRRALIDCLQEYGSYQISNRVPHYFDRLIEISAMKHQGLLGAAIGAWSQASSRSNGAYSCGGR